MRVAKIWTERRGDDDISAMLENELGVSSLLAKILTRRHITNTVDAEAFLKPSLQKLLDPSTFKDMDKAIARISQSIVRGECIGVFGDYDVDGVCSTAILTQFLLMLGVNVVATLPNRLTEGYGVSRAGIDRLKAQGAQLLITADCGITAHDEIDYGISLGLDVIIVDHHTVLETMPKACAIINPKREDCESGATFLCAAGLAFFLCLGLRRHLRELKFFSTRAEPDAKELLDLVALATVCDVVPLIKDNRILVKAGLAMIKKGLRPGLMALMEQSGVNREKISSTNLGFHLGPRINAAGRLDDATYALSLLSSQMGEGARALASELDAINRERRIIEDETVAKVHRLIESDPSYNDARVLVFHNEEWHPGVVGIIASRIAEKYHRPAIIVGKNGKGSGRSIKGIDLYEMVKKAASFLSSFGGHAHAIGVTLLPEGANEFRVKLNQIMNEFVPTHVFDKEIFYDSEISLHDVSLQLLDELQQLEPYGAYNPSPVVRINGVHIRNLRKLNGGHCKGELEGKHGVLSFIAFRMDIDDEYANTLLDIIGVVEKNDWLGRVSPQLRLMDFRKSGYSA